MTKIPMTEKRGNKIVLVIVIWNLFGIWHLLFGNLFCEAKLTKISDRKELILDGRNS